ncbi:hypothetical protein [Cytobacillus kochii]|uniref:hypothetical protein n=1 Tax=Cytobacillus kochii TaxID=859143 RepID=UPI00203CBC68|nr:hypothetical protein [Cytobacillus kochii]MCM3322702.1 hypothetical protein [Cytobacillus kochii]MCM3344819.1 hypothetical protein [Cytobacillus kochii]MDM5209363.1 hypothetical protein [Cytobacillus kochii]
MLTFSFIGIYLMPVLCIVFCLNLVSLLKKIRDEKETEKNTFWLTVSFSLIIYTIMSLAAR